MAQARHKRERPAPRVPRVPRVPQFRASLVAAPLASLATLAVVGVGVVGADVPTTAPAALAGSARAQGPDVSAELERTPILSRSSERRRVGDLQAKADRQRAELAAAKEAAATAKVLRVAKKERRKLWTTAPLNVWTSSADNAKKIGELDEGKKILVTGRRDNGRVEVVVKGEARWVSGGYLSDEKPEPAEAAAAGLGGTCSNGSSVPSGVSPNIAKVHDAVCAAFPEITSYGTFRGDGDHSRGIAVDIMVSGSRGWEVANFVREHYREFGVSYVIYSQRIWSVQRGGEGWRGMSDRGSATANHYDHVHVTTY